MSIHRDCGKDVTWAARKDDPERFMPPLEMIAFGYVLEEDGTASQKPVFQFHTCDPDDVAEWRDRLRALATARGESPDDLDGLDRYNAAREREREAVWLVALGVDCPRCLQPKGVKCISMAQHHRKAGESVEIRNPHPERLELAEAGND